MGEGEVLDEVSKVRALGELGIELDKETRAAEVARLAAQMEEHKRKLEKELREADEREQHYQDNNTFGAF